MDLKFGDDVGPNLCRVKKLDVSSTFIENIFRSGFTLVSSNDIITIKIDKKKCKKPQEDKETKKIKQTQIMRWKKDNLQIFTFKKNVLRQLLFLEIVSLQRL